MAAPFSSQLDHIVILLPAADLDNLPSALTNAFTITPGGTHADGKTYNKLVILQSGVYLEFIAFTNDSDDAKKDHWWGKKTPKSIVDWAVTSRDVEDVKKIDGDVGDKDKVYDEPRKGGRKRPDGKSVEWYVTFPKAGTERGTVPFFCHDVTPRSVRVPIDGAGVDHPSGAVAVKYIVLVVAQDKMNALVDVYDTIFGEGNGGVYRLQEPHIVDGTSGDGLYIELKPAWSEAEKRLVSHNGGTAAVREISLWVKRGDTQDDVVFGDITIVLTSIKHSTD